MMFYRLEYASCCCEHVGPLLASSPANTSGTEGGGTIAPWTARMVRWACAKRGEIIDTETCS